MNGKRILPEEAWDAYCLSRLEPAHNTYDRCVIGAISRVSGVPEGHESTAAARVYGLPYSVGFGIFGVSLAGSEESREPLTKSRRLILLVLSPVAILAVAGLWLMCICTKRGRLGISDGKAAWTYVWLRWEMLGRKWPEAVKSPMTAKELVCVIEGDER